MSLNAGGAVQAHFRVREILEIVLCYTANFSIDWIQSKYRANTATSDL